MECTDEQMKSHGHRQACVYHYLSFDFNFMPVAPDGKSFIGKVELLFARIIFFFVHFFLRKVR